jgi:type I restriction enzyme S subunit
MSEPTKKALVPVLRFPEFRDAGEWKIKPLDKLFTIGNGKDYKHLSTGDIPVYGSGGYMLSVNDYLYDGESVCIGRKGTINNPIFLTGKFWTVDTLFYTHSFKACSPKFIYLIFQNINWLNHNEAGGVPSLSKANISKIEVAVPEPDEQQKIADCLTSIDELVTAQTQKIETLKAHKKGLMQQLFPAEGETVPKLRFPEFREAGKWEKRQLSKLTTKISDGIHTTPIYDENGEYGFINGNNLLNGDILIDEKTKRVNFGEFNKHKKPLDDNSILMSINGTIGNLAFYRNEQVILGKSACFININEKLVNKFFIYNLLQTDEVKNFFTSELTGSTIKNLSLTTIKNVELLIPELLEQQKIADCLTSIDELVTTQTQKIETLKAHKKGLMQQLFPNNETEHTP